MPPVFQRYLQKLHHAHILILSFLVIDIIGSVMLYLPISHTTQPISLVDAVFTSTSALCVTGLTVLDTAKSFSTFGQMVILTLIQVGGLGVMTFSVFLFLSVGRGISVRGRWLMQETFTPAPIRDIHTLIKSIFLFTFLVEGAASILLALCFWKDYPFPTALYHGFFHSISAFCNAGFSTFSNNLMNYTGHAGVNLTICANIIIGGLGFPVIYELYQRTKGRSERRALSLHTRMVIVTTGILILTGTLLFWTFEANNVLAHRPFYEKCLISVFQSITPRTAGFNTVDTGSLTDSCLYIIILLMFIGASPGSTGGGIKTSTLAVLTALVWNKLRGRPYVHAFNRTIPSEVVMRSISLYMLSVFTVLTIHMLMLFSEMACPTSHPARGCFLTYLFETISAFGTVGLSMGVTPYLNSLNKLILSALMFMGRVGILTFAYVIVRRERPEFEFRYSEEKVMIG